jgi:hypothetical protein
MWTNLFRTVPRSTLTSCDEPASELSRSTWSAVGEASFPGPLPLRRLAAVRRACVRRACVRRASCVVGLCRCKEVGSA